MIDFIINVVLSTITIFCLAYGTSKYKVTNGLLFVILNISLGCRLVFMSANTFFVILNLVYICVLCFFLYAYIANLIDLNRYGAIEKVLKSKKKALLTLNMLFITLTMFNFSEFKDNFVVLFLGIVVLYLMGMLQMDSYDDELRLTAANINTKKVCTIKQIAEAPDLAINKSLPTEKDKLYYILEALEIISDKNNAILLLKDRSNIENTVCIDIETCNKLNDCLGNILLNVDIIDLGQVLESLKAQMEVQLDNDVLSTFINLEIKNFNCFNNYVISDNLVNRISQEIELNLDRDNYDITQIKYKYNMEAYTLSLIADYCGFGAKLVIE